MTENEKAATFIGWKSEDRCNDFLVQYASDPIWKCRSGHEFPKPRGRWKGGNTHEHSISAPDMSRPENYMQALDAIEGYTLVRDEAGYSCALYDGKRRLKYEPPICNRPTLAQAVTEALAALYDAEPEETKVRSIR